MKQSIYVGRTYPTSSCFNTTANFSTVTKYKRYLPPTKRSPEDDTYNSWVLEYLYLFPGIFDFFFIGEITTHVNNHTNIHMAIGNDRGSIIATLPLLTWSRMRLGSWVLLSNVPVIIISQKIVCLRLIKVALFILFYFILQYLYSAFIRDPKRFYLNYMTRLRTIVKLYTRYD